MTRQTVSWVLGPRPEGDPLEILTDIDVLVTEVEQHEDEEAENG